MQKKAISFLFILLIAIIFRLSYLGWGLPNEQHPYSYHPDEAKQLDSIANMHPEQGDFNPDEFIYPSLQYYINAVALKLASFTGFVKLVPDISFYIENPNELAHLFLVGRFITVIFSIATILLIYFIGKRLWNENAGLVAMFILSILPLHIINSKYMTVDIPLTFWITLTLFFSTYILKENKWWPYILAGLSAGFATATKYPGILVWFLIFGAHVLRRYTEEKGKQSIKTSPTHMQSIAALSQIYLLEKKLVISGLLLVFGFFIASPYVFLDYHHSIPAIKGQLDLRQESQFDSIAGNGIQYHKFTYQLFAVFPFIIGIPLYLLLIYFCFKPDKKYLLFVPFLASFFIFTSSRFGFLRYYLPMLPFFALMLGHGIDKCKDNGIFRIIAGLAIAYTLIFAIGQNNMFKIDTRDQALQWIEENVPENSTLLVDPWSPLRYTPFRDSFALSGREVNDSEILKVRKEGTLEDVGKYKVGTFFDVNDLPNMILKHEPDYIVITSLDYNQYYRNQSQVESMKNGLDIYKKLREKHTLIPWDFEPNVSDWNLTATFKNQYFTSFVYTKIDSLFESSYASPRIEIYQRLPSIVVI